MVYYIPFQLGHLQTLFIASVLGKSTSIKPGEVLQNSTSMLASPAVVMESYMNRNKFSIRKSKNLSNWIRTYDPGDLT